MPVISLMSESAVRKHLRLRFRTDIFLFKGNHEDHPMPALNDTSIPDSSIDLHSSAASPALSVVAATPRNTITFNRLSLALFAFYTNAHSRPLQYFIRQHLHAV
jgi:hypothetical protein